MVEMKLNDGKLMNEALSVINAMPHTKRVAYYDAILHTGEHDLYPSPLEQVVIKRDYEKSYSDYIDVLFNLPLGDVVYNVYPKKDTLEMTLIEYQLGGKREQKYKFLIKGIDQQIKANRYDNVPQETLNRKYTRLRGQCVNKTAEAMRKKQVNGVYKNTSVDKVIVGALNETKKQTESPECNMSMKTSDNQRKYDHIVVPNGTNALALPQYLQNSCYGVYNGDIGTYIQNIDGKDTVHIYPKYDKQQSMSGGKTLIIIALTKLEVATIENTYAVDGDTVKIIVPKSDKIHAELNRLKDKGASNTSTESDSILSRPFQVSQDKLKIKSEYTQNNTAHKKVDNVITRPQYDGVTNNQYKSRSAVVARDEIRAVLTWKFSQARLLTPAMPLIYMEEIDDEIVQREGKLMVVDTVTDNNTQSETTMLTITLKPDDPSNSNSSGVQSGGNPVTKVF